MGFSDYNSNPDLNTSISGVNIGEGCPPSGINNAIRQIMADAKTADGGYVKNTSNGAIISSGAVVSGGLTVSSGATIKGGLALDGNGATTSGNYVADNGKTDSTAHQLNLGANANGNAGLWDATKSKWLIGNNSNGTFLQDGPVTVTSGLVVSGGLTMSSGTISGTCTSAGVASKVGTATVGAANKPVYISAGVPVSMAVVASASAAATATSATNASSLGGVSAGGYVTKAGEQSISGHKTFSGGLTAKLDSFFDGPVNFRASDMALYLTKGYALADAKGGGYTVTNDSLYCTLLRGGTYVGLWDDAASQWIVRVNDTNGTTNSYWHYGTVKTVSDEREKKDFAPVSDILLDAWGDVRWQTFRYRKGGGQTCAGIVAQQAKGAMLAHGIDAEAYGFLTHERWEKNEDHAEAGDKYYVDYSEAQALEAAYQRRRADRAEARIAELEGQMTAVLARLAALEAAFVAAGA